MFLDGRHQSFSPALILLCIARPAYLAHELRRLFEDVGVEHTKVGMAVRFATGGRDSLIRVLVCCTPSCYPVDILPYILGETAD